MKKHPLYITLKRTTGPEVPHIDPRLIPAEDYVTGCRVLATSIRRALAAPEGLSEYEDWKRRQAG